VSPFYSLLVHASTTLLIQYAFPALYTVQPNPFRVPQRLAYDVNARKTTTKYSTNIHSHDGDLLSVQIVGPLNNFECAHDEKKGRRKYPDLVSSVIAEKQDERRVDEIHTR
jgi:hypothetical protein